MSYFKIYPTLLLLVLTALYSCREDSQCIRAEGHSIEEDYRLAPVSHIEVELVATVHLNVDTTSEFTYIKVIAQGNIIDEIDVIHRHDFVSFKFAKCIKRHSDIDIHVTVPDINEIVIHGAGDVVSENLIETSSLNLITNGPGDFDLLVETDTLTSTINQAGNLFLSGRTIHHNLTINGSGDVNAFNMISDTAQINVNASGVSNIYCRHSLTAILNDRGDIRYRGMPEISTIGSGSAKVIDANL